jgi:hypothetical protein
VPVLKPSDSTVDTKTDADFRDEAPLVLGGGRRVSAHLAGHRAYAGLLNLFAVDAVAQSRISASGPESWLGRPGAWQWDAITALGVAAALLAGYMVAELLRRSRLRSVNAPAGWALVEVVLLGLVWHASPNSGGVLVLWQFAGAALLLAAAASSPAEA